MAKIASSILAEPTNIIKQRGLRAAKGLAVNKHHFPPERRGGEADILLHQ
jgi:hypothetical protein